MAWTARLPSARALVSAQHEMGEHQDEDRDHGHSRGEQQQLLEQDPAAIPLLAFLEKLHRRPANALLPPQIDQVDQDGHSDERQADREQGGENEGHIFNLFPRSTW